MRFIDKNNSGFYKSKKGGFEFTISFARYYQAWYVVASHLKKDIRLNTLWLYKNKTFKTYEDAVSFCEDFDHTKYCKYSLGDDSNCA